MKRKHHESDSSANHVKWVWKNSFAGIIYDLSLFPVALTCAKARNDLSCYQCQSHDLDECAKPKYLKPCPDDQAYDRCETILEKKRGEREREKQLSETDKHLLIFFLLTGSSENATVTKKCSLAPCVLDSDVIALTQNCDTDSDSYSCSLCCKSDGCNDSSAAASTSAGRKTFLLILALLLVLAKY